MKKLTPKREAVAAELAKGKALWEAYLAGYPNAAKWPRQTLYSKASEAAADPMMKARVAELRAPALRRLDVTVERVLQERARLAFFDVRQLLDANGNPKPLHELDDDAAAAIAGVDFDTETRTEDGPEQTKVRVTTRTAKLKLADKNASLTALEKHLGMYSDEGGKGFVLNIQINRWQP